MGNDVTSEITKKPKQLAGLWQKLVQTATSRNAPVAAIDVEEEYVHVVQAARSLGRVVVTALGSARIESPVTGAKGAVVDAKVRNESIAKAIRRTGIKPGRGVMGIPRNQVILRNYSLPKASQVGELASMVQFQISKDLPFRMEDAIVDFKVQDSQVVTPPDESQKKGLTNPENEGQKVSVLVAAIKKEVLKQYQDLARIAGFRLVAVGLNSYANTRCVEVCHPNLKERCSALITLQPDQLLVDILLDRELVFSRVAALPPALNAKLQAEGSAGQPEAGAGNFMEAVVGELVRTLHSYEGAEENASVSRLFLVPSDSVSSPLIERLRETLKIPVEIMDPFQHLKLPGKTGEPGKNSLVALGLALGCQEEGGLPFDFVNPKQPVPPGMGKRTKILLGVTLFSVLFCLFIGLRTYLIRQKTQIKNTIQQQVTAASKSLPLYKQTIAQARTVKNWLSEEKKWLDHLDYLSAMLPPSTELYVTSISTGSKGAMHLFVKAVNSDVITRLDTRLREAGYEVKPPAVTPSGDRYGFAFQANLEIAATDRIKMDLSKLNFVGRPEDDGSLDSAAQQAETRKKNQLRNREAGAARNAGRRTP